jgi:ABC-type Fe3+-hydroxamate transport system substrate-binding protein
MAKLILVAASTLCGGVLAKNGKFDAVEVAPGTELTDDVVGKLGLNKAELQRLQDNGAIAEVTVREAGDDASADLADELAAAIKRAEEAEAKLAALEAEVADIKQQLDDATKPDPNPTAAAASTPAA